MLKKICLLVCQNLYSSKLHFTEQLGKALQRLGVEVKVLRWPFGPVPENIIQSIREEKPDLTASFNQPAPLSDKSYFFEHLPVPHLTMLLDPAIYDINLASSSSAIVSCVDYNDCELFSMTGFEKVFFFPHAIEKELFFQPSLPKTFDVVFMGTCYDPDGLREWWRLHHPQEVINVIEEAVEIGLSDNCTSFYEAVMQSMRNNRVSPKTLDTLRIAYYVDFYMRGKERIELIRSIKDAPVHIFGTLANWREEKPIQNWEDYFRDQKNVILHQSLAYSQSLEILKQTKICLNSSPMFKNGSHERVFASLACGALPLVSDNLFMREAFEEDREIVFFQYKNLHLVNEQVNYYLSHENKRKELVENGRGKVLKGHTWDIRAKNLVDKINYLL